MSRGPAPASLKSGEEPGAVQRGDLSDEYGSAGRGGLVRIKDPAEIERRWPEVPAITVGGRRPAAASPRPRIRPRLPEGTGERCRHLVRVRFGASRSS